MISVAVLEFTRLISSWFLRTRTIAKNAGIFVVLLHAMKRSDSGLWGGLFWWWVIGIWVHAWLKEVSSVLFWIAYAATVAIGGYLIFLVAKLIAQIRERRRLRLEATKPCEHGVKGGETRQLCPTCAGKRIERENEYALQRAAEQNREQLKSLATTLRTEEHVRLAKARLHQLEFLLSLSPSQFEDAIALMYRQLGYEVKQTPMSNDFGRDAILTKEGKKHLVECKRYSAEMLIGRPALQKFYAAIIGDKADGGFFITTSNFAHTAVKYAQETNITCIDGKALSVLMLQAYPSTNESLYSMLCHECGDKVAFDLNSFEKETICRNNHQITNDVDVELMTPNLVMGIPTCPRCGKKMRIVSGYRGTFWGCSGYPKCLSTKPFRKVEGATRML
jgi:restriction system protein